MRTYNARHISRLTSVNVQSTAGMDFMERINFDSTFTHKEILKLQIMVDTMCDITINGHSVISVHPQYGLLLDYTDIVVKSLVINTPNVNVYAVIGY